MRTNFVAALPRLVQTCAILGSLAALVLPAMATADTLPTQSWNGYHWARTGPLAIQIGSNLDAHWSPYFSTATSQWSTANNISFVPIAGTTPANPCDPVYGTVQVCNSNYGRTGWLGYATVYIGGDFIVEATVKLNDYYFASGRYDTSAWKAMTACQEIGHTLGLAHADTIKTDVNKGTCMDYTNDPTGTVNRGNGTLANIAPSASDFAALNGIYANLDATQLSYTKPGYRAGDALAVGEDGKDSVQAVPEPAAWALMMLGFGLVGSALRRRSAIVLA